MIHLNLFEGYRITSPYGERKDPFTGVATKHAGIDLSKYDKAPIEAFIDGKVVHASVNGTFGICVVVEDKYGYFQYYAHLDSVNVKIGANVARGDVVGKQGNTGRSTASHLHFEVRTKRAQGYDVDPTKYLTDYYAKEEALIKKELVALIVKFSTYEKNSLSDSINKLHKLGYIDSPKLWLDRINKETGTVSEYVFLVTTLLTRIASK